MVGTQPLELRTEGVGKRHGRQWILRGIDLQVPAGGALAILGSNGSGKSSLLRILCGFDAASEGSLEWHAGNETIPRAELPGHIAYGAPDQSLILDLTVAEHIAAHGRLRMPCDGVLPEDILRLAMLENHPHSRVRDLSSGMRQRLALSLAFTTEAAAIFLDEPVSHLDRNGRQWYSALLEQWRRGRTLVVASNHNAEELPAGAFALELGS